MNPDVARRFDRPLGIYLLSHSIGLPPSGAEAALVADHFASLRTNPSDAWPTWLGNVDGFRVALASLLNTVAASICPQPNVSSGLTKVLGSLPDQPERPTILMTEDAFPSLGYVCQRMGLIVRYIGRQENALDPAVWATHFDASPDLVLITHVHSNTGELIPAAAIAELARERSIVSIVDVAQSVGVIPIDLAAWDADVVLGSCVKWSCGGPGAGWSWVSPSLLERCEPRDVGWWSHEDPFEFDIHRFRYAADGLRFWGGTPAVMAATVARRSLEVILEIGIDAVRDHNVLLTDRLITGLSESGVGDLVVSPRSVTYRSGTVIVDPGSATAAVAAALGDQQISADHRPSGFRLSPHVYNSTDDIDATVATIRSASS